MTYRYKKLPFLFPKSLFRGDNIIRQIDYNDTKLIIVGIVHNSKISLERVKNILSHTDNNTPVLLEYCQRRYETNQQKKWYKSIWHLLAKTHLTIESFVIDYCRQNNRPLKFIDIDIREPLKRYYKRYPVHFLIDICKKLLGYTYVDTTQLEIALDSTNYIDPITAKWTMLEQRDTYMAKQIKQYIDEYKTHGARETRKAHKLRNIIVIVGKAHVPGILEKL